MPASIIRVLPDLLVNKIAAGEVVERPASVVKELMENAIDAGASHLQVAIADGGKQLIRVTDDGSGMSAEDLTLAVTPHATSKLASEDDLYHIGTLGFRGEALASIGAVSHMRIVSRPGDCDEGAEIRVSAERIESCSAAGAPPGTSVEIRDLFFNVPARRKFLRTTSTEVGHVNEQFTRIALPHERVGFELTNNNRVTQRLASQQTRADRIAALFDDSLAEDLLPIRRDERGLTLEAYAAPPARSRPTAAGQYVFLNGRFIRDRIIGHAIREAYRGLIEPGRYPVVFLFLTLDPGLVDVNVHPTKIEVRWQDGNLVRSQVLSALRETFLRADLTPDLHTDVGMPLDETARDAVRRKVAEQLRAFAPAGGSAEDPFAGSGASQSVGSTPGAARSFAPSEPLDHSQHAGAAANRHQRLGPTGGVPSLEEAASLWRSLYESPAAPEDTESHVANPQSDVPRSEFPVPSSARPAIQLHNTYLVTETDEGLMIIDQHALHERVIYEQLRARITSGPLESQRLLLPETVEVTPHQLAVLEERSDLLQQLGLEVTRFGTSAVAVQSFPVILSKVDARTFVLDLIDRLDVPGDRPHTETLIHELLDMMACKAAVKAGDPLTPQEIEALIEARALVEKSSNCPHGRPTTLRFGLRDLEKQFKRT
ncbi:MAG: DNA mismatch repair endonuclease MutL [Phycisphaerae bacterium]